MPMLGRLLEQNKSFDSQKTEIYYSLEKITISSKTLIGFQGGAPLKPLHRFRK